MAFPDKGKNVNVFDIGRLAIGIMKILRPVFRAMKKHSDGGKKITLKEFEEDILPECLAEVSKILYTLIPGGSNGGK